MTWSQNVLYFNQKQEMIQVFQIQMIKVTKGMFFTKTAEDFWEKNRKDLVDPDL